MKIYKIRNKLTGLYKTAGIYGMFNKQGKSWSTLSAVKLAANLASKDCEIVVFEIKEVEIIPIK